MTAPANIAAPADDTRFTVEARFYQRLSRAQVRCRLCPRSCTISDGSRGHCGVRENRGGMLFTVVYSRVCAAHIDPVEKKPLFHYLPGTTAFSIGTAGCNVHCKFCQNWSISQARPEQIASEYLAPARVAEIAAQYRCPTIAFTYTEPVVFSEFAMDTADAAHEAGIRCIAVSNGYMQEEALQRVYGKMDAVKIDLKAFTESFYRKVVKGRLQAVLDSIVTLRKLNKWVEIVYLVVPAMNDSDNELRDLARWCFTNLGADVPLHFTQFHPDHDLRKLPVTPVAMLERARSIAIAEGLHYVYIGNVAGHPGGNTYCPQCCQLLIERIGMGLRQMLVAGGRCPGCGQAIPGIWKP